MTTLETFNSQSLRPTILGENAKQTPRNLYLTLKLPTKKVVIIKLQIFNLTQIKLQFYILTQIKPKFLI